jgi:hypothetical protein
VEVVSGIFRINRWTENEYGERHAVLDEDIELRLFRSAGDAMVLQGVFGDPITNAAVANANEARLGYVLQANFIRIIHHNNVLSIDKKTDRLALTERISMSSATVQSTMEAVEAFVKSIDFWTMALKRKRSFSALPPLYRLFQR